MARNRLWLVGLAAGVVTVAGCGGKSSSSTPPPTTTAASGSSGGTTLDGTVGPGFDIALKQDGKSVTTLAAGTYTLNVDDQSSIHNFHLTGPGVDVTTTVPDEGKKTFTITLQKGKYHFQCDPHASSMNGDFSVS